MFGLESLKLDETLTRLSVLDLALRITWVVSIHQNLTYRKVSIRNRPRIVTVVYSSPLELK